MGKAIKTSSGFTIVELLIVIIVISILAAITVIAFNAVRQRAEDVKLVSLINTYTKAFKLYKAENGVYPTVTSRCLGVEGDLPATARFPNNRCNFNIYTYSRDDTLNTALASYIKTPPRIDYSEEILDTSDGSYGRGIYYTGGTNFYYLEYYIKNNRNCPIGTSNYSNATLKLCYEQS